MLVYASLTIKVKRPPPKIINARTYSKFNTNYFRKDIEEAPWSVCFIFDDPDDVYYGAFLVSKFSRLNWCAQYHSYIEIAT